MDKIGQDEKCMGQQPGQKGMQNPLGGGGGGGGKIHWVCKIYWPWGMQNQLEVQNLHRIGVQNSLGVHVQNLHLIH